MMEGISEAASKNKRGRPGIMSAEWIDTLQRFFPEEKTRRGILGKHFELRAVGLLKSDERFKWLVDDEAETFKPTLLEALGRFDDDDALREVAEWICELKPTAKAGERLIREMRFGARLKEPDAAALAEKIRLTINRYFVGKNRERFLEVAKEALETIRAAVSWRLE